MQDREIIEKYITSIKEELIMYADSLSEKTLPYIDCLKHRYEKWEKDLAKLDGTWEKKEKHKDKERKDIEETEVDEKLYDAVDEFADYKKYKDEYINIGSEESLNMARQELTHFMMNLKEMFKELNEHSRDNAEERALIKSGIKEIYQIFG
jgi:hypothetical protein